MKTNAMLLTALVLAVGQLSAQASAADVLGRWNSGTEAYLQLADGDDRQDRRQERGRSDERQDRRDCRQEEGRLGKDKRECKQEEVRDGVRGNKGERGNDNDKSEPAQPAG